MLPLEERFRLVAVFDDAVRSEETGWSIETLLSERYEEGCRTDGRSFPLPPSDMQTRPRDVVNAWQTTWTRAHEIVCSVADQYGVLGKINVYLAANRLWSEAVERFTTKSLSPVKTLSPEPASSRQLTLIHGGLT